VEPCIADGCHETVVKYLLMVHWSYSMLIYALLGCVYEYVLHRFGV
jgi:hypothetical protein